MDVGALIDGAVALEADWQRTRKECAELHGVVAMVRRRLLQNLLPSDHDALFRQSLATEIDVAMKRISLAVVVES